MPVSKLSNSGSLVQCRWIFHPEMVMFNTSSGNFGHGELGLAAIPDDLERFKSAILGDFARAEKFAARSFHVMAGKSS